MYSMFCTVISDQTNFQTLPLSSHLNKPEVRCKVGAFSKNILLMFKRLTLHLSLSHNVILSLLFSA